VSTGASATKMPPRMTPDRQSRARLVIGWAMFSSRVPRQCHRWGQGPLNSDT
jgi:hypothetical protein